MLLTFPRYHLEISSDLTNVDQAHCSPNPIMERDSRLIENYLATGRKVKISS